MGSKKDNKSQEEYPQEDNQQQEYPEEDNNQQQEYPEEENHEPGNAEPQREEQEYPEEDDAASSVCSSEARDRKDLEECPGEDLRAKPVEHSGGAVTLFYVIFAFISFVFMLTASCPIPWLNDGAGRKWTLWKDVDGTQWKNHKCDHKRAMFQGMQAFSIIGCVLSLVCFITGLLQMVGIGHLGVTILFCVIDVMVLLTDWALLVNQYHKYSCPGDISYIKHINRLNAGFCLVFISFALMLFGLIALVYWMNETFSLSELHRDKYSVPALKSAFVNGAILTIATVGTAQTMWEQYYTDYTVKVTYWHVEFYDRTTSLSEYWPLTSYHCSKFTSQMRAAAAFSIISDAFLFLTLLGTVGAVYNRLCKWLAIGFGVASWVFLVICWAISVATRYKTFCKDAPVYLPAGAPLDNGAQQVHFTGYIITEGLGMIISAWCALTISIIYMGVFA